MKNLLPVCLVLLLIPGLSGQSLSSAQSLSNGLRITVEERDGELAILSSQGTVRELVIPGFINGMPVTAVGSGAFTGRGLASVTIPDSVTSIGDQAFSFNEITVLTIGNNVVSIGQKAFFCNKIEKLILGESVNEIGMGAFAQNNLTEIIIPENVNVIGSYAFFMNRLRILNIPGNVSNIGEGAFSTNRLHTLVIQDGVREIGDGAFYNNQLTGITLPESVAQLGKRVFESRTTLRGSQPPVDYLNANGEILYTTSNNFDTFYTFNGKKPGKYSFRRNGWEFEGLDDEQE